MLCRFYGFSIDEVMGMTFRCFNIMIAQISEIIKIENGETETKTEKPLEGKQAFGLAQRIFKKGKRGLRNG